MGELDFIAWIRQQSATVPQVQLPIGDDCAALAWQPESPVLITTDMLLEGSCFLREAGPERIGKKAMSVNLSDMAAMAGKPVAAVVSLGLPRDLPAQWAKDLYRSLHQQAAAFNTIIIGGDTNSWTGPLCVNVTLLGEATGTGPVSRSGAKPGDQLWVTGPLGGSILGHHLDFTPRVKEAQLLHSLVNLHAMIDLSDGLSSDLHHLCDESGCGAELWAESIVSTPAALQLQDSRSPLEHALHDGEDFELLFAVSEADSMKLQNGLFRSSGMNLYHIGRFIAEKNVVLKRQGSSEVLPAAGYEHQLRS